MSGKPFLYVFAFFIFGMLALGFWAQDGIHKMPEIISAVADEDLVLAQQLIDEGADVSAVGPMGITTMLFAIRLKNIEAVKMLMAAGYNTELPLMGKDILIFAREVGDPEILAYLESVLLVEID